MLGPKDVNELCKGLGVVPSKQHGQNFVHDAGTVRRIAAAAEIETGDHVLEIGPGLGSLTLALLETDACVTAVELDPKLALALPTTVERFAGSLALDRLRVINQDATKITGPGSVLQATDSLLIAEGGSPELAEEPNYLVANLPYNIAVPLILGTLEVLPSVHTVLVMVQDEVADRLVADPGSRTYGIPSLKAAWYGQLHKAGQIGRMVFHPVPNVDSALVKLVRHDNLQALGVSDSLDAKQREELRVVTFTLIDAAFAQRRKTLRQALAVFTGTPALAQELLETAGFAPNLRGEALGIAEFVTLGQTALKLGLSAQAGRGELRAAEGKSQ
ncbi:MAG: 16S rRNA (adenine(1518)-N(6)/adenine(1519)-N(6))-dimethyltransferase RsmA [Actinomycetaceae bacterium]|nr:16S rRNA (adenine(1518)-N(6)/adenine(1519)-N(6))-dimethyltransferase RsmA [Actinomycetaceae bacterium]